MGILDSWPEPTTEKERISLAMLQASTLDLAKAAEAEALAYLARNPQDFGFRRELSHLIMRSGRLR